MGDSTFLTSHQVQPDIHFQMVYEKAFLNCRHTLQYLSMEHHDFVAIVWYLEINGSSIVATLG